VKTLEQAYIERASIFDAVEATVKGALLDFCNRNGFLLAWRAKGIESLRDKIETGRYADLESLDDIIAFSIVIDTLGQEENVREFLKNAFNVISLKSGNTLQDERSFDFDSTRVYCRLDDKTGTGSGINEITFEVQIRTLLQHAWSKITHPFVYKARVYNPKAGRLAAELMAQLESADRIFAQFQSVSESVKMVIRRDMAASSNITAMIDELVGAGIIPSELRPENGKRLGENIYAAIRRDRRDDYQKAHDIIRQFIVGQKDVFPRSVSIFQLAIMALHEFNLLDYGSNRRPKMYYVTDELISLFPNAAAIKNKVNIV